MNSLPFLRFIFLGATVGLSAVVAQTTVDFNSAGHLDLNFITASEGTNFSQSADGGLDGSGAVSIPALPDNQFWAFNESYAGNTDHTISVYVHSANVINTGYVSFGITGDPSQTGVLFPSSGDYMGVRINLEAEDFELKGEGAFNHTGADFDAAISTDSWYYFELTYDWQFNQTYGMQFRAYESDASGNLGASLIAGDVFSSVFETSLADDPSVFAFFGGNTTDNIITHLDNFATSAVTVTPAFSAVPEPSSYPAILGALALGLVGTRRRGLRRVG